MNQFVEALKEKFEQVNVGFPVGKKMLKWALRSMSINLEEILKYVEIGVKEGATLYYWWATFNRKWARRKGRF